MTNPFKIGDKVKLGREEWEVVEVGKTVRGGHDVIGRPGLYHTVTIQNKEGKRIRYLSTLLQQRVEEERKRVKEEEEENPHTSTSSLSSPTKPKHTKKTLKSI